MFYSKNKSQALKFSMDEITTDESKWVNCSDQASLEFFEILQLTNRRSRRLSPPVKEKFFLQQLEIVDEFRLRLYQISDIDCISHEK